MADFKLDFEAPIRDQWYLDTITHALMTMKNQELDLAWEDFPGGARIRSYRARFLQALLKILNPEFTLELGSGSTTQIFAKYCRVFHNSLEHHPKYYDRTSTVLAKLGLTSKAKVNLTTLDESNGMYRIPDGLPGPISLILIDGPPLYPKIDGRPKYSRVNTLPILLGELKIDPRCIILFDSIERPWEQECLKNWVDTLGIQFEAPEKLRGLGVIDPNSALRSLVPV